MHPILGCNRASTCPSSAEHRHTVLLAVTLCLVSQLGLSVTTAEAGTFSRRRHDHQTRPRRLPRESIDLQLTDRIGLSANTIAAVTREVDRIFDELGARTAWRQVDAAPGSAVPSHAIQIVLSAKRPEDCGQNRRTMGVAFASPHTGFARGGLVIVFPYKIAEVVSPIPKGRNPTFTVTRGKYFSQALGRVIAHEIIHIVLPSQPHSADGVMNATQNRRSFSTLEPVIDTACAQAFRAALQSSPPASLSAVATATASIGQPLGRTMPP